MTCPRMRQRARPLPLLLAVIGHASIILLILLVERRPAEGEDEEPLVYVLPITVTANPATPARAIEPPLRPQRPKLPAPALAPAETPTPPPSTEPPGTIHLPPTDWQRELQQAARRSATIDNDSENRQHSLDSRPKVLELPKRNEDPPPGTVTMAPNGDRIVQYKNGWTCTSSDPPLSEHFSVWAQFRVPSCTFKGNGKEWKLDVRKPAYLERPLPAPRQSERETELAPEH